MTGAAIANERKSSAEEAVALMKKAQDYLKVNGLDKAIAEFNNPASPFNSKSEINKHGDLYLYSVDPKGFQVNQGINPVSKQMEDKAGYLERVGNTDLCLGTGIYK